MTSDRSSRRRATSRLVLVLVMVFPAMAPARALTPEQAQSLSIAELARMVLGQAGAAVIAVDRPEWRPSCGGPICPPVSFAELQRRGPAPLTEGIVFYQRATPTPGGAQSIGLCTSIAIKVEFTAGGAVSGLSTYPRYGLAPDGSNPSPTRTSAHRRAWAAESAACATIHSADSFFVADDGGSAYRAALASRQLADAVRSGVLTFGFSCRKFEPGERTRCAGLAGAAEAAQELRVANLAAVKAVPCDGQPAHHACYEIDTRSPGGSATIEMTDSWEDAKLVRLDYHLDDVVY